MCTADLSLKLIAASCLLIIATDSFVMSQIFQKQDLIQLTSDPEIYRTCFKPQIRMRLVFTGYAINSAAVCFMLTVALMIFDEYSAAFDRFVNIIADYMYIAFGPVLFIFCLFGLVHLNSLSHECLPTRVGDKWNLMDIVILFVCTALSFAVLFVYSLTFTNRIAERDLAADHTVFYQVFSTVLNRQKKRHLSEKKQYQAMAMNDFFDQEDCTGITNDKAMGAREESKRSSENFDFEFTLQPQTTVQRRQGSRTAEMGSSYGGL